MTRKPLFWIAVAALGVAGSIFALRLFPVAFPILSVDIEMSRGEALAESRELARRFDWGPEGFRQAASFGQLNPTFQTYLELEGGGLERLNQLVEDGAFSLYAWRVRHFTPGLIRETEVRFGPDGSPLGFRVRIPEDEPGEALDPDRALELAVAAAEEQWGIDFVRLDLLESAQEERSSGRIDHTFVFQRSDLSLGEARVRLRLGVAGDRLSELTPILHAPDAFVRRYQDTRNANEGIALVGTVVFLLLFLVVGGGLGAVRLLRERRFEWKAPLAWGALVAGLMAAGSVNSIPLAWMGYDTALPANVHITTVLVTAGLTFLAGTALLTLIFMVGEGLMRLGFPQQIQQWKVWSPGVANSTPVLGRTIAPYLIVGFELGFVVAFYLITTRFAGWWSPASSLTEPDLLATYFPWVTAVGTSLFAAFSEETIFRAIPIGAAAILGRRYGKQGLWIWGAVVLQALVFGASHANYPQQPAYARVVEIFPTYLAWGAVCVYFGLIPSILGHYLYDLVFFSLPLFAADTSGIWFDRVMVVGAGLLPLGVVLWYRLRHGARADAPDWALNRNWGAGSGDRADPGDTVEESSGPPHGSSRPAPSQDQERIEPPIPWTGKLVGTFGVVGLLGLALWVPGVLRQETPRLSLTLPEAQAKARSTLLDEGFDLDSQWIPQFSITGSPGRAHQFVWREGGEEAYRGLAGDFLSSAGWRVRFINFQVPPEERAESFAVTLSPEGGVERLTHMLPEGRAGASLSEEEARALALQALRMRLGLSPETMREVSAEEDVQPARTDWTFTFAAESALSPASAATPLCALPDGDCRAEIHIAGDQVVDALQYVKTPEEWEREWRSDQSRRMLASLPSLGILSLLGLGALVLAAVLWAKSRLDTGPVRVLSVVAAGLMLLTAMNEWPNTRSAFSTELSLSVQAGAAVLGLGLAVVFVGMALGLGAGLAQTWLGKNKRAYEGSFWMGLALGTAVVGMASLAGRMADTGPPPLPSYSGVVSYLPWLSAALGPLLGFLALSAATLLVMATLDRLRSTSWSWSGFALVILLGTAMAPNPPGSSWGVWIGASAGIALVLGGLWFLGRRMGWGIVPPILAAPILLSGVETMVSRPFPGAALGAGCSIVLVVLAARAWSRAWSRVWSQATPGSP